MSREKEGVVAVVTGGATGIGQGAAVRLAAEGASVAVLDAADCGETIERISAAGGSSIGIRCDVSEEESVRSAARLVSSELDSPTILVNAAGIYPGAHITDLTFAEWRRVLAINLDGSFLACHAFAPAMIEAGRGRIVNISSSVVSTNTPTQVAYLTSKMGVIGLTRALANDLGPHGDITVNAIAPGVIHTTRLEEVAAGLRDDGFDLFADVEMRQAIKRGGVIDDIVPLVSYLTSDGASFITAQTLAADGGVMRTA